MADDKPSRHDRAIMIAAAIAAIIVVPLTVMQVTPYTFRDLLRDLKVSGDAREGNGEQTTNTAALPKTASDSSEGNEGQATKTTALPRTGVAATLSPPSALDELKAKWAREKAEREAANKAETERQTATRARVSRFWRTIAVGDHVEKVFAILGEPPTKPRKDARTGKITTKLILYAGNDGLSVNIWLDDNEKVAQVLAANFRSIAKTPGAVGRNWESIQAGDSAESLLRRLGGPDGDVGFSIDKEDIVNQSVIYTEGSLTVYVGIENGKVSRISGERRE